LINHLKTFPALDLTIDSSFLYMWTTTLELRGCLGVW
jgi:hypothetical protein